MDRNGLQSTNSNSTHFHFSSTEVLTHRKNIMKTITIIGTQYVTFEKTITIEDDEVLDLDNLTLNPEDYAFGNHVCTNIISDSEEDQLLVDYEF